GQPQLLAQGDLEQARRHVGGSFQAREPRKGDAVQLRNGPQCAQARRGLPVLHGRHARPELLQLCRHSPEHGHCQSRACLPQPPPLRQPPQDLQG
ncbi:hypothetical protein BN1708_019516, partial [Verticillium longisporum]